MREGKVNSPQQRTTGIDWSKVHRHIENVRTNMDRAFALSPEEKKRILAARAQALAREQALHQVARQAIEVVEFLLAEKTYAIESTHAGEVYPLKKLTPVPCTSPFVLGIMNVGGQILSVIDLRKFFDLEEESPGENRKVIVVRSNDMELGILADAILRVRSVPLDDLYPPFPTLKGIQAEFLRGLTRERLMILDVAKILSDKRIIVNEEVEL